MDPGTLDRLLEGWRRELRAPAAFRHPGRHLHVRPEPDADWGGRVGVVTLGDATCVSLPAGAPARLRDAAVEDLDADLTDPAVAAAAFGPFARVAGPAILAFLDPAAATVAAGHRPGVPSVPAGHDDVRRLAATCGREDADESGILAVDSPVAVWRAGGRVVAASGYQVWHARLAHLSVLVDPAHRARGLGATVAAGAVTWSLAAGLVPQWRARTTLTASRHIAHTLGFEDLGRQATFTLSPPRSRWAGGGGGGP